MDIDELLASFPLPPSSDGTTAETCATISRKGSLPGAKASTALPSNTRPRSGSGTNVASLATSTIKAAPVAKQTDDVDYVDLLSRACRGVFPEDQRKKLNAYLLSLSPTDIHSLQEHVHRSLAEDNIAAPAKFRATPTLKPSKNAKSAVVEVSKHGVVFHGGTNGIPIETTVSDTMTLSRVSGKDKISFSITPPPPDRRYTLVVSPLSGFIKKKQPEVVKFSLTCKTAAVVQVVLRLSIEGGLEHFVTVNVATESSKFGVPIGTLEMGDDQGYRVPVLLHTLRHCFDANGGVSQPNVFMQGGADDDVSAIKRAFSRDSFMGSSDVHAITSVIKAFYRELPERVFGGISAHDVLLCETRERAVALFNQAVHGDNRAVLLWLFTLLAVVASHSTENNMDPQKLGICMTPHLWSTPDDEFLETADTMRLSRLSVNFVTHLLDHHIAVGFNA